MNSIRQLQITAATLALASLLIFSPDCYGAMLARSFMAWWALAFAGLAGIAMVRKSLWWALSAGLVTGAIVVQVHVPGIEYARMQDGGGLRVASMNVWQSNKRFSEAVRAALLTEADVIAVQEVDPAWAKALTDGLGERYPYHHVVPRSDCYGIALFSRIPFVMVREAKVERASFIMADVEIGEHCVRICAAHATSPISPGHFERRNAQLTWLARELRVHEGPGVLMGDLNTVPWDRAYRRLCGISGARPVTKSAQVTWPSLGPIALIPIDHVLVRGDAAPASLSSYKVAGSDHRGLVAEIRLRHAS